VAQNWADVQERFRQRPEGIGQLPLPARTWQALSASRGRDPSLSRDLQAALAATPNEAALHNGLGLAGTLDAQGTGATAALLARRAVGHFRHAWTAAPGHVLAGLNLVEALAGSEQDAEARQAAGQVLARLERSPDLPADVLDAGHFPPGFDPFRI